MGLLFMDSSTREETSRGTNVNPPLHFLSHLATGLDSLRTLGTSGKSFFTLYTQSQGLSS